MVSFQLDRFKRTALSAAVTAGVALGVSGCGGTDTELSDLLGVKSVTFSSMPAPATAEEVGKTYSSAKATVTYEDGSQKEFPLSYNKLFGVKDKVAGNSEAAGQLYARDGSPILDPYGQPVIAETPDGNSLLQVADKLFLVTHLEYDWLLSDGAVGYKTAGWHARMPMGMVLTTLEQDEAGSLKPVAQRPIDFSSVNGLYIPCFASQTPWNTHLGSEENYDIDARTIEDGSSTVLSGLNELYFKNATTANPYHYGLITEVTVEADGSTSLAKHYAMGRATWEMGKVMADGRTVYLGSDGTNQPLIMFVADREGDLSAGTLYAAKWSQNSSANGGAGSLSWIKLGHGDDATLKALADSTKFSDIFDWSATATSQTGFKTIRANAKTDEHIRLKPGMEQAAAFLEVARYAAFKGATTEFNKMEGVAANSADKKVYIAISRIGRGMLADTTAPVDDIQLPELKAGAVFELSLASGQRDSDGAPIDSDYVATTMQALVTGEDIAADAQGNVAAVDKVANPDNIFYSEKMRTLFIGEDSGYHVNNYLWAYNIDSGKLSRILSLVAGAESTGLQVAENIDGHTYIMSNAQHQGDFIKTMDASLKASVEAGIDKFDAPVGYLIGLPEL